MSERERLRAILSGGDRRSLGRAAESLAIVEARPASIAELVPLLWDADAVVRMRASDVIEKLSLHNPEWLEPHKPELLGSAFETHEQEVRWHLAAILPRLKLSPSEHGRVLKILETYLTDKSSIVKTFAMQGLWDISRHDAALRESAVATIQDLTRTGTAAMRARGRKLMGEK